MRRLAVLLLLLAGCAGPAAPAPGAPGPPFEFVVDLDHDHDDPLAHTRFTGFELAAFVDARDLLGDEAARLSDLQFHGDLATVAVNGRAGASSGGFLLLDASEPTALRLVGRYRSGSEDNWYTKFSPDGRWVFLTANGNTEAVSAAGALAEDLETATLTGPARGLHVVDVSDPARPRFASVYPAPVRAINAAPWEGRDGSTWVFASIIQDRAARPALEAQASRLNHVAVLRLDPSTGRLDKVTEWTPAEAVGGQAFPHDLAVARHPARDLDILYAAYWDAGGFLVDVTDPANPATLARVPSTDATDHVHTFKPHPTLIQGRALAVLAPETFVGEPAGTYRLLDVTEPTAPREVARWTLPGSPTNTENLLWSPHEFALADGRLYASQYHGGLWTLTLPELRPIAAWQASRGAPERTKDWAVDVETALFHAGLVYGIDMGTGILVLRPRA